MRSRAARFTIHILVAIPVLFWSCGLLLAQSVQYGKITGTVSEESGTPIPGVQVELTSDALISGKRMTTTSENGGYIFLSLPLGTYRLTASLDGFTTMVREKIELSAGAVATIDLTMKMGQVAESLTVTAEHLVDTKTSTVETKFVEEQLERIPTNREPFYDLTLTAPGMFDAAKDSAWLPSPTAYGSAASENSFLVDGVNTTDPRGGAWGTLVNVNFDSVEEVRVIALGSKAEYGSSTGVAVDVLTKSGSNAYHGVASIYGQIGDSPHNTPDFGDDLGRDWLFLDDNADPAVALFGRTERDREFSFTLGGPILKNKVWFFTSANIVDENLKKPLWPVLLESRGRYFDVKASAEPIANHQFWAKYHLERNKSGGDTWGDGVPWDSELQYDADKDNNTFSSQWQWAPNSKSLLSAKYLGFWTGWDPSLPANAPVNPGYINWWKWQDFGVNGHFPYIEGHDATRHTIQADMSHYAEDFLGRQDIKFGVQYTTGNGTDLGGYFSGYINYAYPRGWQYDQPISYLKDYFSYYYGADGWPFYAYEVHMNPFDTVRNFKQTGFFADDQWTVTDRITLNLGLRYDMMSNKYGTGHVYENLANPHDDVSTLQVIRDRQATGNVFDFKNWSPRIGGTYALTEDGRTVVRANFGRYYAPVGLENLRRWGPDMPIRQIRDLEFVVPWDQVDLNGNGFIDSEEVTAAARLLKDLTPVAESWRESDPSWSAQVKDGTKNQFMDQWTVNFEREIVKDLSFSATYIHKKTGDILVNIPINRTTGQPFEYERIPFTTQHGQHVNLYSIVKQDYDGDGDFDFGDVTWVWDNSDYQVQNLTELDGFKPERIYDGLQFVVSKRFSNRAQMLGSFLYSDAKGPANRNNFQDWNIEGPEIMDTTWFGSLNNSINNMTGPLPFTPKYEFKLSGSYMVPKIETDFGLRLRYNSGRPTWFIDSYGAVQLTAWESGDLETGVLDVGSTPWIVSIDPEDPLYLPSSTIVDLRFAKFFNVKGSQTIQVSLDCFNIFNTGAVSNVDWNTNLGQVTAITGPRKFRAGLQYQF